MRRQALGALNPFEPTIGATASQNCSHFGIRRRWKFDESPSVGNVGSSSLQHLGKRADALAVPPGSYVQLCYPVVGCGSE